MRKTIIRPAVIDPLANREEKWLDLDEIAAVEVTSENPDFPIELALVAGEGPGWRAAESGEQLIRIVLNNPRPLRRIRVEFSESAVERTQEFTLRWSQAGGPLREIVRQQWNFGPQGSTSEIEDYQVQLEEVSVLELQIKPSLTPTHVFASLAALHVA